MCDHKRHEFREEVTEREMCDSVKLVSEKLLILRIIQRYIVMICLGLHVKYTSFSTQFNQIHLSRQIFEKTSNINFRENMSSGSRTVFPCRWTDMMKLGVAFRNAANTPKNKETTTSTEKSNWLSLL